jgi:hypothetical protein
MADLTLRLAMWLAGGLLALLLLAFVVRDERKPKPARSVGEMDAGKHLPLKPGEAELAAQWHADVLDYRTGEQPRITRKTRRRIVRRGARLRADARIRRQIASAVEQFAADPLTGPIVSLDVHAPLLDSLPQPPSFELESFTGEWTRAELDALLATAKAGAR